MFKSEYTYKAWKIGKIEGVMDYDLKNRLKELDEMIQVINIEREYIANIRARRAVTTIENEVSK